jgi:hypothetical protein
VGDTQFLVLEPVKFLRRLAALVPPPRFNLTRYHGVFAPAAKMRPLLRPRPEDSPAYPLAPAAPCACTLEHAPACGHARALDRVPTPALASAPTPPLRPRRLDWASLLKRVFKVDVLSCPCGGRRRVLAFLTDAAQISKVLRHLRLDDRVPPLAPPAQLDFSGCAPGDPFSTGDAPRDLDSVPSPRDPDLPSSCLFDAPFLPGPDPPAAAEGPFDPCRDPLPPDDFADPPAPEPA